MDTSDLSHEPRTPSSSRLLKYSYRLASSVRTSSTITFRHEKSEDPMWNRVDPRCSSAGDGPEVKVEIMICRTDENETVRSIESISRSTRLRCSTMRMLAFAAPHTLFAGTSDVRNRLAMSTPKPNVLETPSLGACAYCALHLSLLSRLSVSYALARQASTDEASPMRLAINSMLRSSMPVATALQYSPACSFRHATSASVTAWNAGCDASFDFATLSSSSAESDRSSTSSCNFFLVRITSAWTNRTAEVRTTRRGSGSSSTELAFSLAVTAWTSPTTLMSATARWFARRRRSSWSTHSGQAICERKCAASTFANGELAASAAASSLSRTPPTSSASRSIPCAPCSASRFSLPSPHASPRRASSHSILNPSENMGEVSQGFVSASMGFGTSRRLDHMKRAVRLPRVSSRSRSQSSGMRSELFLAHPKTLQRMCFETLSSSCECPVRVYVR
mmetsp:Transcript_43873/g.103766  ORF Transcript_43873/g.103766 Transcript_43873/m.103766 type:complete len:450 (-) Transcript_43873:2599-3948(-)